MLKIPDCLSDIQVTPFGSNLKKQKWSVVVIYIPQSQCKNYFTTEFTKILDKYSGSSKTWEQLKKWIKESIETS